MAILLADVTCGTLTDPVKGMVTFATGTLTPTDEAAYACDERYALEPPGPHTRLCGVDGSWSGEAPTCRCAYAYYTYTYVHMHYVNANSEHVFFLLTK